MEVIIFENESLVAKRAASMLADLLSIKPSAVLGLATGSTPIKTYQELIKKFNNGEVSFKDVSTFNLDEYVGLKSDNKQSYQYFMREQLFDFIDIQLDNTHFPICLNAKENQQVAENYEAIINAKMGIDLQLLGIGHNGHIGFNEPSSSLASRTRLKTLTRSTIEVNSRLFEAGETQPTMAMTMGIGTIMDANHILLIATGEGKAEAVRNAIEGAISASCPASILQMHPHVTVLLDKNSASLLQNTAYYQRVAEQVKELN
ncbi:glucosamine-6-phosphate deaminase [Parashewanella curva]|uniref:Glucosamine-6-phosphate deaminase n=1 Tax=Parashewanella curva TaxID=2338552 RepID=A0A3L8Q057_9GAMM|nr:glucosamine-6-phosphate deaminase [Parashewanella curva]RLV61086.1 glucosamine-6-phosphate deaminase [Parashewanella curva]